MNKVNEFLKKNGKLVLGGFALFLLGALLATCAHAAGSQSDDITWTIPTQRVDGTALPITEIAYIEFEVAREGTVIETFQYPPTVTTFNYPRELPPNYTLCYRARTVDTEGQLSDWTAQVCKTVRGRPNPPSIDSVR